jgi:hypothetical protein
MPIAHCVLLVIIIGFGTCARLQYASAGSGMVNDNRQRISIAVPDLSDNSTSEDASWRDIAQGIVSDLKATDRFALAQSNTNGPNH